MRARALVLVAVIVQQAASGQQPPPVTFNVPRVDAQTLLSSGGTAAREIEFRAR